MKYLLDTNICIYLINSPSTPSHLTKKITHHEPSDVGISTITLSELEYGAAKSAFPSRNRLVVTKFVTDLTVVPYDERAALTYGQLRAGLEKAGTLVGALDLLIGAHALSLQATLITNNEREFRRIPDLKVENWAA